MHFPTILGGIGNPFDAGIRINEGGYNWPLSQWRQYYTQNGLTNAFPSDEAFAREFPTVLKAMLESDKKYKKFHQMMEDPETKSFVGELVEHLSGGGEVGYIAEAFPPQAQASPMQQPMPQQPPPMQQGNAQAMDNHQHQMECDADGNGQTSAGMDGHVHPVRGGQCMAMNGHTHDPAQMQGQQAQQPPMQQGGAPFAQKVG